MILHLLARKKKQCYTLISISLDFVNPSLEGENTNKLSYVSCLAVLHLLTMRKKVMLFHCYRNLSILIEWEKVTVKGVVSRNSVKLGNYKMPIKLRET